MTHELTFEQIQKSKKVFDLLKEKKTNIEQEFKEKLSVKLLLNALLNLGFDIGLEDIKEIINNMKLEDSIDFSTFLRITAAKFKQIELVKELQNSFKAFDKHNNQYLTFKELRSIITENGPNLTIDEANELLKEVGVLDEVSDKNFYYNSFVSDII